MQDPRADRDGRASPAEPRDAPERRPKRKSTRIAPGASLSGRSVHDAEAGARRRAIPVFDGCGGVPTREGACLPHPASSPRRTSEASIEGLARPSWKHRLPFALATARGDPLDFGGPDLRRTACPVHPMRAPVSSDCLSGCPCRASRPSEMGSVSPDSGQQQRGGCDVTAIHRGLWTTRKTVREKKTPPPCCRAVRGFPVWLLGQLPVHAGLYFGCVSALPMIRLMVSAMGMMTPGWAAAVAGPPVRPGAAPSRCGASQDSPVESWPPSHSVSTASDRFISACPRRLAGCPSASESGAWVPARPVRRGQSAPVMPQRQARVGRGDEM